MPVPGKPRRLPPTLLALLLLATTHGLAAPQLRGQAAASRQPSSITLGPQFDGSGVSLPVRGAAPAGFTFRAYHGDLARFGMVPLRCIVTPSTATFPTDRLLTVRVSFAASAATPPDAAASYEFRVSLPQAGGAVDQTVYLPKWFMGGSFTLTLFEAGQPLPGYSAAAGRSGAATFDDWARTARGRFAWIADPGTPPLARIRSAEQLADLRMLLIAVAPDALLEQDIRSDASRLSVVRRLSPAAGLSHFRVQDLPRAWQGYDMAQVWISRWSTIRELRDSAPQVAQALLQHVRCGGTLWLLESPPVQEVAAGLATRLFISEPVVEQPIPGEPGSASPTPRRMLAPQLDPDEPVRFPLPQYDLVFGHSGQRSWGSRNHALPTTTAWDGRVLQQISDDEAEQTTRWLDSFEQDDLRRSDFDVFPLGAGHVVCCHREDSLPGSFSQWQMMAAMSGTGISSVLNRGFDPLAGDSRFWHWTIPGVAQPPVYTFMFLLAGFAILVGPLAYWWLGRMGRTYLMFFVAPLLAAATTIILLTYGVLSDGLGTQARIREVTWVCDDEGRAVRYSRGTYFAGIRPAGGLRFPRQGRLEPYPAGRDGLRSERSGDNRHGQRRIVLEDDALRLSSGYLPARQQCQFVTYEPLHRAGGLTRISGSGMTVRNDFRYELRDVVLRSSDGRYHVTKQIGSGQELSLRPLADAEVAAVLGQLYTADMPIAGSRIVDHGDAQEGRLDMAIQLGADLPHQQAISPQRLASPEGQLEWWLRQRLRVESTLPRGMYVALADVTPQRVATPSAQLVDCVHYVLGGLR